MTFEWIAWLGNLIKLFGDLIPQRKLIPPTHRGIKYKKMKHIVVLDAGCYWYWPWFTEIHTLCIAQQTLWLEEQDVTTSDGHVVKVRGTVTFKIRDTVEAVTTAGVHTWDILDQIDDEAMAVYCAYIGENTFDHARVDRSHTNAQLTDLVRERLDEYGVEVVRAQMTSFASGLPLLHLGG